MKPHPRIRKTIKWGGAAVTVLLGAVWIGSVFFPRHWAVGSNSYRGIEPGYYSEEWTASGYGLHRRFGSTAFRQMWPTISDGVRGGYITFPFGGPTLVALGVTAIAWWRDAISRRPRPINPCPSCGYERTGLAMNAKCPECGAASE